MAKQAVYYPKRGGTISAYVLQQKMKANGWRQTGGGGMVGGKHAGDVDMDFTRGAGKNRKTVWVDVSAHGKVTRVSKDWDKKLNEPVKTKTTRSTKTRKRSRRSLVGKMIWG